MEGLALLAPADRPRLSADTPCLWLHTLHTARHRPEAHAHLRHLLADYIGGPAHTLMLHHIPGTAPRLEGYPGLSISLSYADNLCLIGLCQGARIGVDLVTISPIPDWHTSATLYLGPQLAEALARTPAANRDASFARHWSAMEARSKCLSLGLSEYSPARWQQIQSPPMHCRPITGLPIAYTGSIASMTIELTDSTLAD
jgi:4'-phosphopantetheinyl transferase